MKKINAVTLTAISLVVGCSGVFESTGKDYAGATPCPTDDGGTDPGDAADETTPSDATADVLADDASTDAGIDAEVGEGGGDAQADASDGGSAVGHVTYRIGSSLYRIAAQPGSVAQNLTTGMNPLGTGADINVNPSRNNQWLALNSERFSGSCSGWACLSIVSGALTTKELVKPSNQFVHPEGRPAITNDGLTVYWVQQGSHTRDVFMSHKTGSTWGAAVNVTSTSTKAYNEWPQLSADETKLAFHCSSVPYGGAGTSVCIVNATGGGFQVIATGTTRTGGTSSKALISPSFTPDGLSLVFEADWTGEQVWRYPLAGGVQPTLVGAFNNDNSPCVLPDGRVASLYLPASNHQLKIMKADGTGSFTFSSGDIVDSGLGCSE